MKNMGTYRRQIKFCYYKVAKIEINENEESHVVGKFNLVEWLMSMKSKALLQHNVELSDCIVNLGEYRFDSEMEIYAIRAYKFRDSSRCKQYEFMLINLQNNNAEHLACC